MKEIILATIIAGAVSVGWYKFWVEPHDAYLGDIMDCMDKEDVSPNAPDRSRVAYNQCVQKLGKFEIPSLK